MQLAGSWASLPSIKVRELVRSIVETVEIHDDKIIASLKRNEIASVLLGKNFTLPAITEPDTFGLRIEANLRRAGKDSIGRRRVHCRKARRADGCFAARRTCDARCTYDGPRRDYRRYGAAVRRQTRLSIGAHARDVSRSRHCPRTPVRTISTQADTGALSLCLQRPPARLAAPERSPRVRDAVARRQRLKTMRFDPPKKADREK